MTKKQVKFLKSIYSKEKTATEICKELNIIPYKNDPIGGYYNALNDYIDCMTSDYKNEIDDMFRIVPCNKAISNNDTYIIMPKGKTYIDDYNREFKRDIIGKIISVIAIAVSIVIAILA